MRSYCVSACYSGYWEQAKKGRKKFKNIGRKFKKLADKFFLFRTIGKPGWREVVFEAISPEKTGLLFKNNAAGNIA